MTLDEYFEGQPESRTLFEAVNRAVQSAGPADLRVTKSQVAFRRKRSFAWAWMPGKYLRRKAAPLVLSVSLRSRDKSPRWKEIVEPVSTSFMHHLELWSLKDVDGEVRDWLRAARDEAG